MNDNMNNELMNNELMNNKLMNNESIQNKNMYYESFKNQKTKRKYYLNENDFYFYSKIYEHLVDNIPFYDSNKISFTLIMCILLNDLFGNYDFYDNFILLYLEPENTFYNKINHYYNSNTLKVNKFNLIFKQSLLQYKYCKDIYKIKSEFYNLTFDNKFNLIKFHKNKIQSLFYLSSFLEKLNLDDNYFLYEKNNLENIKNIDKYDKFFLNNYYFKTFLNIHNLEELYTSFLIYSKEDNLKNSVKMKKENDFLFFENLNNKIIVSEHADGIGVFSKKFNVSFEKKGNLMISFFKKNENSVNLFNIVKYLPYVSDKTKIKNFKMPSKALGDSILLEYNDYNKSYNFYEYLINDNIFTEEPLKINLSYIPKSKMVIIMINNTKVENLFYIVKKNNIIRFIKNKKKFISIANFRKNKNDLISNITEIILPFEYMIIQVILYFEYISNFKVGGGFFNRFKRSDSVKNQKKNKSLEEQLLKEIGKPPKNTAQDYSMFGLMKENKVKEGISNAVKLLKEKNLYNLTSNVKIDDIEIDEVFNEKKLKNELEEYLYEDKNECLQKILRDTDSWLFQYMFYKCKVLETHYYFRGFEDFFKQKKDEINKNDENKFNIIKKLEDEIKKNSNDKKNAYILELKKILTNNNLFNELLMMFQFNKNWIDNYYNVKN